MRRKRIASHRDPMVTLINIVFLMLVFFMVAGSLSKPTHDSLQFVQGQGGDCCVDLNAVNITKQGEMYVDGVALANFHEFLLHKSQAQEKVRLLPDKQLPANQLLAIVAEIKDLGVGNVVIVLQEQTE